MPLFYSYNWPNVTYYSGNGCNGPTTEENVKLGCNDSPIYDDYGALPLWRQYEFQGSADKAYTKHKAWDCNIGV